MAADLYRVNPEALGRIWKQLSATWKERSQAREGPSAEIRTLLMLREVQLWVALPDHDYLARDHRNQPFGVVLTFTKGKRLVASMVAGRKLTTWLRPALDRLDSYRKSRELEHLDIYARLRWKPYLDLALLDFPNAAFHDDPGVEIRPWPVEQSA